MSVPAAPVKTPRGVDELRHRTLGLGQRYRTMLLLVDGRRPLGEVLGMANGAGALTSHFEELVRLGLVELPKALPDADVRPGSTHNTDDFSETVRGAFEGMHLTTVEVDVPLLHLDLPAVPTVDPFAEARAAAAAKRAREADANSSDGARSASGSGDAASNSADASAEGLAGDASATQAQFDDANQDGTPRGDTHDADLSSAKPEPAPVAIAVMPALRFVPLHAEGEWLLDDPDPVANAPVFVPRPPPEPSPHAEILFRALAEMTAPVKPLPEPASVRIADARAAAARRRVKGAGRHARRAEGGARASHERREPVGTLDPTVHPSTEIEPGAEPAGLGSRWNEVDIPVMNDWVAGMPALAVQAGDGGDEGGSDGAGPIDISQHAGFASIQESSADDFFADTVDPAAAEASEQAANGNELPLVRVRERAFTVADHARPMPQQTEEDVHNQVREILIDVLRLDGPLARTFGFGFPKVKAARTSKALIAMVWEIERQRSHSRRSRGQLFALERARELLGMGNTLVAWDTQPSLDDDASAG